MKKRKKKERPFSESAYEKNIKQWEEDKEVDSILATMKEVEEYYKGEFGRGKLFGRLKEIELYTKWSSKYFLALATGYIAGLIIFIIPLYCNMYDSILDIAPIGNSLAATLGYKFAMFLIAVGLLVIIIFLLFIGIKWCHNMTIKIIDNNYTLYVLPYERNIITRKLFAEYGFAVDNFGKADE